MIMLKKLVKYGNSSALVLDKPLLELLNIAEGAVVKIKTDGISLIITPHNANSIQTITPSVVPQETLQDAVKNNLAKHVKNPDDASLYHDEIRKLFIHYGESLKKLNSEDFQKKSRALETQYQNDTLNPSYARELTAVRYHYAPELKDMDKQIQALSQKYAPIDLQMTPEKTDKLGIAMQEFKKIHEKYSDIGMHVSKLQENADYINESVLLAEKYHALKDSIDYIKEYSELIAKYVPEYKTYQDELRQTAELLK